MFEARPFRTSKSKKIRAPQLKMLSFVAEDRTWLLVSMDADLFCCLVVSIRPTSMHRLTQVCSGMIEKQSDS